jgi:hypothetical protein
MSFARVERLNLGLSAGAVAASFALSTPHFAFSMAAGALLEAVNFGTLHRGARHFFDGEIAGAGPWVGLFAMRFVLLGTGIFLTLAAGAHPVALVIGLSIAMPAVLIDGWLHRPRPLDHERLPALDPGDPSWDDYSVWRAAETRALPETEAALDPFDERDGDAR